MPCLTLPLDDDRGGCVGRTSAFFRHGLKGPLPSHGHGVLPLRYG